MNEFSLQRLGAAAIPSACIAVTTGVWLVLIAALLVPAVHAALRGASAAILALALAVVGLGTGAITPARWLRVRPREQNGRIYARLGVRHFRTIALRGDIMNRVQRRIGTVRPAAPLSRAAYPALARWTMWNERIHWAWVLATPPLVVWAPRTVEPWSPRPSSRRWCRSTSTRSRCSATPGSGSRRRASHPKA
jgi:hypothetical protein